MRRGGPSLRLRPSRRHAVGLLGVGVGVAVVQAATSPAWPAVPRANWVDVRAHGAVGDGRHDDTAAVQRALAAVPDSGGVLHFPAGTYRLTTVYIQRSRLVITGDGSRRTRLIRASGSRVDTRLLAINSRGQYHTAAPGAYLDEVHVQNLHLDGNGPAVTTATGSSTVVGTLFLGLVRKGSVRDVLITRPRESGVNLFGCHDTTLQRVTVDGMTGDYQVNSINVAGDRFRGDPGWPVNRYPSRRIQVRDCRVVRNWVAAGDSRAGGGIAVCIQGSEGVRVVGCTVDLSGDPTGKGRAGSGIIFEGGGPVGAALLGRDLQADGNTVRSCAVGIGGVDSNPGARTEGILTTYSILGNRIEDCGHGIQVAGRGVRVSGNTVRAVSPLVLATGKPTREGGYTIEDNRFISLGRACVESLKTDPAGELDGVIVRRNVLDGAAVKDPTDAYGIVFRGAVSRFEITRNVIRQTLASAVYFWTVDGRARAEHGVVTGNTMTDCCRGVRLQYPSYYGVVSAGSRSVVVKSNRIIGGRSLRAGTASLNRGRMTVLGNTDGDGDAVRDIGSMTG